MTSAEPIAVGKDLDDVHPDELEARRNLAARPEQVGRRHAARFGRARSGRERGVEDVDVDGEEHRPVADRGDRPLDHLADPEVADVVHEERRDPVLRCHANSVSPGQ